MATETPTDVLLKTEATREGTSAVSINYLDSASESVWDRFVTNHPAGTFFHQMGWKRVMERTYGYKPYYLCARRNNELTGIAPAFLISNWVTGRCLMSLPFAVYGGVCASDKESEQGLITRLEQLAAELRVGHLELRNRSAIIPEYHEISRYSTFTMPIGPDTEAIYRKFPKDMRYMIRKGEKVGLRARSGIDQLDTFYRLMTINLRRLGTPAFPKSLFENLVREYPNQIDLTVVYVGDKALAGGMSFFFRDWTQPYYIGSLDEAKALAANNFLWWQLIKQGAEKGCSVFDFGRSKNASGNFEFKKRWKPLIEPLRYQVRLIRSASMPNNSQNNPKFEKVSNVWKKLPLPLTRSLGPRVVRWFP